MQRSLKELPNAMRVRRSIVEHVFGTDQGLDGAGPLPDPKAGKRRNRDVPSHPRLQRETRSRCPRCPRAGGCDPRIRWDWASRLKRRETTTPTDASSHTASVVSGPWYPGFPPSAIVPSTDL